MSIAAGQKILQSDMTALATLANSKTTLAGKPYAFPEWAGISRAPADNPKWLTELNRLRGNLQTALANVSQYDQAVSGEWPLPSNTARMNYLNQKFYYEDTGNTETITVEAGLIENANFNQNSLATVATTLATFFTYSSSTSALNYHISESVGNEIEIFFTVSEGDSPTIKCTFNLTFSGQYGGTAFSPGNPTSYPYYNAVSMPNTTSPLPLLSIDTTNWPFGDFTITDSGAFSNGACTITASCVINQTVAAGTYSIKATIAASADDNGVWERYGIGYRTTINARLRCDGAYFTAVAVRDGVDPIYSLILTPTPTVVNGIDNAADVLCLDSGHYAPTILLHDSNGDNAISVFDEHAGNNPNWTMVGSVDGLWTGKTTMVSGLNVATAGRMPWNQTITKYGSSLSISANPMLLQDLAPNWGGFSQYAQISNSYTPPDVFGNLTNFIVENQLEPIPYLENRWYTEGFSIMDRNGNIQLVTRAGKAATYGFPNYQPSGWATTIDGITYDGGIIWKCIKVFPQIGTWQQLTNYALGDVEFVRGIAGDYGIFTCTQAGISGDSAEVFHGQTSVNDGTCKWIVGGSRQYMTPAVHRPVCVPKYPIYWEDETEDRLKPPTAISGLTIWGAWDQWRNHAYTGGVDTGWQEGNKAYGWWIYSISLNRVTGNTIDGVNWPASSEVSVTIGCMRNGSFVAFDTFITGSTHQVLWPVFTSDALVYQCSERVDIQAVAIATNSATKGVTVGTTAVGYPIAAAFVTDVEALLNLIT